MNASELFEILQRINSLTTYCDFFYDDFKARYLEELSGLKKKINEIGNKSFQPVAESMENKEIPVLSLNTLTPAAQLVVMGETAGPEPENKPLLLPTLSVPKPPPPSFSSSKPVFNIKKVSGSEYKVYDISPAIKLVSAPVIQESVTESPSVFSDILEAIMPKITDNGKNIISDLSLPIEYYRVLKMIDNKSSILELFNKYGSDYKNFLEFMNIFYQLYIDSYIYFTKTREHLKKQGWIKLGEIMSEGKVTSALDIEKALVYQKSKKKMFIGEAMVELNLITPDIMNDGLRIQKIISRLALNSEYVGSQSGLSDNKPVSQSLSDQLPAPGKSSRDKKLFSNILDFIIPVLNSKGQEILNNPEYHELAGLLKIIDGNHSLLNIFEANKTYFKNKKLLFLKFLLKLDSQALLDYKKNFKIKEREIRVKYAELLISLDLITETQLQVASSFKLSNEKIPEKSLEAILAELQLVDSETLEECLKINKLFNEILEKISYENAFVGAIEKVLNDSFNIEVDIGPIKRLSFNNPLSGMICIVFTISGTLNGNVYYILDRSFMNNLAKTLLPLQSAGNDEIYSSVVQEISNMITGSGLTCLSNVGIPCTTELPQVIMEQEIIIANKKPISVIPLMSQLGRFAIGLEVSY
jgi:CheY-specific phosphatase CheX